MKDLTPSGTRRMGANPHANGGLLKKTLRLPDFHDYARSSSTSRARWKPKTLGRWESFCAM